MKTETGISLVLIQKLDEKWKVEIRKFLQSGTLYGSPPPLPLHEEYAHDLPKMAARWGVAYDEFLVWVKLQHYISEAFRGDCEDLPLPEIVAFRLGIDSEEFQDYYQRQLCEIHEAFSSIEDTISCQSQADWNPE